MRWGGINLAFVSRFCVYSVSEPKGEVQREEEEEEEAVVVLSESRHHSRTVLGMVAHPSVPPV